MHNDIVGCQRVSPGYDGRHALLHRHDNSDVVRVLSAAGAGTKVWTIMLMGFCLRQVQEECGGGGVSVVIPLALVVARMRHTSQA